MVTFRRNCVLQSKGLSLLKHCAKVRKACSTRDLRCFWNFSILIADCRMEGFLLKKLSYDFFRSFKWKAKDLTKDGVYNCQRYVQHYETPLMTESWSVVSVTSNESHFRSGHSTTPKHSVQTRKQTRKARWAHSTELPGAFTFTGLIAKMAG